MADQQTPFLKQLVSSDTVQRGQALESLRAYLTSNRNFTELELMKLWKGLFFCMWHADRPRVQQRLADSLAELALHVQLPLFVPFVRAFWATMIAQYPLIDSLRLDKYLLLVRRYVNAGFRRLACEGWQPELLQDYLAVLADLLLEEQGKVSDGLRFHVLDVWIDELDSADPDHTGPIDQLIEPVQTVQRSGRTKTIRQRAQQNLSDSRVSLWSDSNPKAVLLSG